MHWILEVWLWSSKKKALKNTNETYYRDTYLAPGLQSHSAKRANANWVIAPRLKPTVLNKLCNVLRVFKQCKTMRMNLRLQGQLTC